MYARRSGLILGFHGCDQSLVDKVISGQTSLEPSKNNYDWLGHGIYFWEYSPSRALEFAEELRANPGKSKNPIKIPAVIGAVIDLGKCMDLLDFGNLQLVKEGYNRLNEIYRIAGKPTLPQNRKPKNSKEKLLRELDCAVFETVHLDMKSGKKEPFDSVRGVFSEGDDLYPDSGFKEKDHIQICIRNPNCIKGYFLPRKEDSKCPSI
jgi:hypothetical protein